MVSTVPGREGEEGGYGGMVRVRGPPPHTREHQNEKTSSLRGEKRSCLCYDEREANFSERQAGANGKK